MKTLHWKIPRNQLKSLGYTFQKLYARNHQTYRKEVSRGNHKIWLWVLDKTVEVDDWYQHTHSLVEFYKNNKHNASHRGTFKVQLQYETGFIQMFDKDLYYNVGITQEEMEKSIDNWYATYPENEWREVFFNIESMEILIKELELLQLEVTDHQTK